jgi:uncharacterized membrane protein YeaQ/YmgE (transglycosylase-associated protein family)
MGLFSWLLLGFLAGTLAGMATGNRREGCLTRIGIGVLGAFIGGALARAAGVGHVAFRSFTWQGLLVATAGAALLLLVLQAINGTRPRSPRR